ncbi:hypothetical protein DEU56DRAFT_743273 [Suillus clintonianus]|uniref:uncharacterized protein n=1 Tax=Suillus clintonianus TaxID=1904413 RepID=UPI001B874CE0|nr:uncharacterized protein DEU56DRAFT_743273 [Suillus clintonianus]KAG2125955.1 hypothetical protein DEU56DRAFT_743273 [Suillus clintonianus]
MVLHSLEFISSSSTKMHNYMVRAPDHTNEGTLARRMTVQPKHVLVAITLEVKVAGGLLKPESQDAEPQDRKFAGSALINEAESSKDVRGIVKADLYWREGVWDKEKLVILPIVMASILQERAGITQPTKDEA